MNILMRCLFFFWFCTILYATDWSSPPTDIASGLNFPTGVQVSVGSYNKAVAVWTSNVGGKSVAQAATWDGTSWSVYGSYISDPTKTVSNMKVTMNSNGHAIAMWGTPNTPAPYSLQYNYFDGTSWLASPIDLFTDSTTPSNPVVQYDDSGNAIAVWLYKASGGSAIVQSATWNDTSMAWSSTTSLSATGQDASEAQISVSASGKALAVWRRSNGSILIIQSHYYDGTNWIYPSDVTSSGASSFTPQVAINDSGNGLAVWYQASGTVQGAQWDGSTWSSITSFVVSGGSTPQISIDSSGRGLSIWTQSSNSVRYSYWDTSSWSSSAAIPGQVASSVNTLHVALDEHDKGIATWNKSLSVSTVQSSDWDWNTLSWSSIVNISDPSTNSTVASLGLNPSSGTAVVGWGTGAVGLVQATTALGTPLQPTAPTNFSGSILKNIFFTQIDVQNHLTWTASTDPTVVGYKIYVGSDVVATVLASEPLMVTLHNRVNHSYTYKLVGYNSSGNESEGIYLSL